MRVNGGNDYIAYVKNILSGNVREKKTFDKYEFTYLIDENGVIEKAFGKVKAADNPAQMLGEL